MTDYISRAEAMSFPISIENYDREHGNTHFIYGIECYREYVSALPSVITRCEDCDHYDIAKNGYNGYCHAV